MRQLVVGLLFISACSAQRTVDTTSIEAQIAKDVATSRGVEVKASCPGDVKAEKGGQFDCRVTDGKGNSLSVRATQTNDSGHVTWVLGALNIPKVQQELTKSVSASIGAAVEVACPAILVESRVGKQIACAVTDQHGRAGKVVATVVDDKGNISWELNPGAG